MRNAFYDLDDYPSLCICDNDAIYSKWFTVMMDEYFGTKVLKIPIKKPQLNGRVERFHLSLKTEAFNKVTPINLRQTQIICDSYKDYYNNHRPHQGIDGKIPSDFSNFHKKKQKYFEKSHLNGKIISFESSSLMAA